MNKVLIAFVFVLSTAVANVMQKKAVEAATGGIGGITAEVVRRLASTPYLWYGMIAYAISLAMYLVLLSRVPLNVATSVAALNFVAVLLASRLILGEPIPPVRYLGFALIVAGLFVVSRTQG